MKYFVLTMKIHSINITSLILRRVFFQNIFSSQNLALLVNPVILYISVLQMPTSANVI